MAHREREFTSCKISKNSVTEENSTFCKILEIIFIFQNSSFENKNSEKQQNLIKKLELTQIQEKTTFSTTKWEIQQIWREKYENAAKLKKKFNISKKISRKTPNFIENTKNFNFQAQKQFEKLEVRYPAIFTKTQLKNV